jgi:hypothetical protein
VGCDLRRGRYLRASLAASPALYLVAAVFLAALAWWLRDRNRIGTAVADPPSTQPLECYEPGPDFAEREDPRPVPSEAAEFLDKPQTARSHP